MLLGIHVKNKAEPLIDSRLSATIKPPVLAALSIERKWEGGDLLKISRVVSGTIEIVRLNEFVVRD
jgi:hypothetical protein